MRKTPGGLEESDHAWERALEDALSTQQQVELLAKAVSSTVFANPQDERALRLRLGMEGGNKFSGVRDVKEVGDILGVTKERARQWVGRALRTLKREHPELMEALSRK